MDRTLSISILLTSIIVILVAVISGCNEPDNDLTMAVSGNGSTTPAVGVHTYNEGTVVDITAFPDPGWYFVSWTGYVTDPNLASTTVIMEADKTVTANFSQVTQDLTVPHQEKWGIYGLDMETQEVELIYSTSKEIQASALRLNGEGDKFVFAQTADGSSNDYMEIYSIGIDGSNLTRLTDNEFMDVYPVWSSDDAQIAFISQRKEGIDILDIYVMNADGSDVAVLYDSGSNDADIDWVGNSIVFTSQFAVWKLTDGSQVAQITDMPDRGEWGDANLPNGDYDPRLSPDGQLVAFERLEDTSQPNGGYNIFVINIDGSGEKRLTDNSYAQGLVSWSHSGESLVYLVAAINGQGKYDIYMINSDGTENHNITPDYFPADFLCHSPIFSADDSKIYFIGQWWD